MSCSYVVMKEGGLSHSKNADTIIYRLLTIPSAMY